MDELMLQNATGIIDPRAVVAESVAVGAGTRISAGAYVGSNVKLGSHVVIGANVTFVEAEAGTNASAHTLVEQDVVVGAGAVIYAGVVLAAGCLVRPGTIVTRSVPPGAIVEGSPAVIVGYVATEPSGSGVSAVNVGRIGSGIETTPVKGVTVHQFPVIPDLRGNLTVGEFDKQIPFIPRRYFMVFGVPNSEVRGEHAHHACHQFLICVRGSCAVMADDGHKRVEVALTSPDKGIYLPPMTWGVQYKYSPDALLLVFASHHYDAADYIREYTAFLDLIRAE
jgi:UDP-2-acetamido-3-amino-2,3-dideoxy-glucuronate N-acetyltransferase